MKDLQDSIEHCPKCNASLQGEPIPADQQHLYGATHFSRKIGIEDGRIYDGISWWQCPDCKYIWKAYPWGPEYSGGRK